MNKQEFLQSLRDGLSGLPQEDMERAIDFYEEMIDDRIEEGIVEEEAIATIGTVDEVVSQIISEIPLSKLVKERVKPKRKMSAWEIVLLVLGSPIWISVLIAIFAVIFSVILSVYVVLWSVVISLWAVEVSFIACAVGGIAAGIVFFATNHLEAGLFMIGAALICASLSIFLFFGCKGATKGIALLTKKMALGIKSCFVKKGDKR